MGTHRWENIEVRTRLDHVEVFGMDEADVSDAIELFKSVGFTQVNARRALSDSVSRIMLARGIPLVPQDSQRQVQRSVALRERLLTEHGAYTYAQLAELREIESSSVRTWISRLRQQDRIFTVDHAGRTFVPAILLSEPDTLDESVGALITPLLSAGMDEWAIWAWLVSPTGLLSGEVPADMVKTNPSRALKAAVRRAEESARVEAPAK